MVSPPSSRSEIRQAAKIAAKHKAMHRSTARSFRYGMVQAIPLTLVIIPFGLLFGVVALEAGIDLAQTMGFSILVLAGASQFTVLQLLSDNAPIWLTLISGLAVNLRLAMYSASLVPWLRGASKGQKAWIAYTLIDQTYTMAIQHYERVPELTIKQRVAHFLGCSSVICSLWMIATWVGATIGKTIPDGVALDFAIPITFLAMIAPMLRTIPHLVACFTSIVGALAFAGLPSGLGLLIAAPIAMIAGAVTETLIERRNGKTP